MVNHAAGTTTGFPEELQGDSVQLRFALPPGDGCWLKQERGVIIISTGQAMETQMLVGRHCPSSSDAPTGAENLSGE